MKNYHQFYNLVKIIGTTEVYPSNKEKQPGCKINTLMEINTVAIIPINSPIKITLLNLILQEKRFYNSND